jgi:acyl carrier protein
MTQIEIELMLIKSVTELQELSGREPVIVTSDMTPLEDLEDFDSLNGVEVTVDIFEKMQLDLEFNNVFLMDARVLSIKEAATRISEQILKGPKHGGN